MYSEERRHEIMTRINRDGRINTAELTAEFDVTGETVRKDLSALEQLGLLQRTHGGAIAVARSGFELNAGPVGKTHVDQKTDIIRCAATYIRGLDTVLVDHGTSTDGLPRFVPYEMELRIVTNSLTLQNGFLDHPKVTTMAIGGILRPNARSYVGPWAIRCLRDIRVDLAILATSGISAARGLTSSDVLDSDVKEHMLRTADRVVLVADSSKVGVDRFHRFGDLEQIDVLITDAGVDPVQLAQLRDRIPVVEVV